jgi:predicted amidophosphoribosyltransferase
MEPMIDCWSSRNNHADPSPVAKRCCTNCSADFWHIRRNGEVFCADCDEPSTQHFLPEDDCRTMPTPTREKI